ncbi:HEAT repeat domain-containing protein [Streptomyces zhihengii]|uniref:HEAT repeat domain-containing protein n=1 Tax=Streptomyces zhihengii TaxID=1818004 RepID=UPI001FD4FA51|nr:HEAT repeat domain-containing protein [Streptomyces zhihengii]
MGAMVFAGIDEVDWASLEHSYGPAENVPELLRGLASADPAERESALDGMYGTVHHHGDVYDSTLACIPFLMELVADPLVEDRGAIIELLTSIGGIDLDGDDELDPDDEGFEDAANYAMAASAVTAGCEVFLELAEDHDREVRLVVPLTLASLHSDPVRVLRLLRHRLEVEKDDEVRLACVEAGGRIALRHKDLTPDVVEWLTAVMSPAYCTGLRLGAVAQLARCAPASLPDDVVPWVTGMLRRLDEEPEVMGVADPLPASFTAPPREIRAAAVAGRAAPWTAELLRTLHTGLADRVDDRVALLADQFGRPDRERRLDAVRMSENLLRTWRGAYGELVVLLGEQVGDCEPQLADAAAGVLGGLFELARPAADALLERVETDPDCWVRSWGEGAARLGRPVMALVRAGDARVVPILSGILGQGDAAGDLACSLDSLGPSAAPLAPALCDLLSGVRLDGRLHERATPLLRGLSALRAADLLPDAVPAVLRVLRGAPGRGGGPVVGEALRTLTAFGPAAGPAAPELRMLIGGASAGVSAEAGAQAAGALWAIEGEADAVLPALCGLLNGPDPDGRRTAASVAGALGAAGAETAPLLGSLLRSPEPWTRIEAATALWRVTGDPRRAWPVLRRAWTEMPYARVRVAGALAELSTREAEGADRLVDRELLTVRRHNAMGGGAGGHDIFDDERLLALCRRAVTGTP